MNIRRFYNLWRVKNLSRRIIYKIKGYKRPKIDYLLRDNEVDSINSKISEKIKSGESFLVSRLGRVEMEIAFDSLLIQNNILSNFKEKTYHNGKVMAGVFPQNKFSFMNFSSTYLYSLSNVDIIATWLDEREKILIDLYCHTNVLTTDLNCIEPFFSLFPWISALRGKNVLIVHPFKNTIELQLKNNQKIISNNWFPPIANYIVYKPVVSNGEKYPLNHSTWDLALKQMIDEIKAIDFDVAVVAAGAYGLPLSSEIKSLGKVVIHLAGASQLLFKIIGGRWEQFPRYKNLMDDSWIRPLDSDIDNDIRVAFQKLEGPGYW